MLVKGARRACGDLVNQVACEGGPEVGEPAQQERCDTPGRRREPRLPEQGSSASAALSKRVPAEANKTGTSG